VRLQWSCGEVEEGLGGGEGGRRAELGMAAAMAAAGACGLPYL
jgi:hypothetical protein